MRVCSGPGCGRAIPEDQRFCYECKPQPTESDGLRANTVSDRQRFVFLYTGAKWRYKVQPLALKRCPFCARCEQAVSVIVDHIVPAGVAIAQAQESKRWPFDKWAGFYLMFNLQGLCRSCHFKKTAEDQAHQGEWPNVVAKELLAPKRKWTFV